MNPPIRQKAHQEPLWEAVVDGTIDMIATDHAPHAPEEKVGNRIWDVACGFPGVETSVRLMLTTVADGRLSLERYVTLSSAAPARAFGLYGQKGVLRPGADADLILVDLDRTDTIRDAALHSRGNVTPFDGRTVRGIPVMTMVRGTVVAEDGEVVAKPGTGRIVCPKMPPPAPRNVATTLKSALVAEQRPW